MTAALDTPMRPTAFEIDDDTRLVLAAQRGDTTSFQMLASRYERRILRLARNVTQNDSDAEEVTQDAFLRAFEHINTFRGNSRFYTWLVRIAINQALMKLRKRRPNHFSLDDAIEFGENFLLREVEDWGPTPEERYSQNELAEILSKAIARLSPAHRIVFQLRDVEGLSTEETARLAGISVQAVKSRLLRARLILRERLSGSSRKNSRYANALLPSIEEGRGCPQATTKWSDLQ